jgi:hypothetical protein
MAASANFNNEAVEEDAADLLFPKGKLFKVESVAFIIIKCISM